MPNYFYTDANGNRRGPITPEALKALASQRIITPNTPLETDSGKKGLAGQLSGLFNAPQRPAAPKVNQTTPPSVPIPVAEEAGKSSWLITVIGIAVVLVIGTIGWSIINTPSTTAENIELAGNEAWFSPDGKTVVTKVADNSYAVWDAESGKELQKLEGLEGTVMTFSQDSKKMFMRGTDNTLRMWDIKSGKGGEWIALDFVYSHQWGRHFQISPDGKRIIHRTGRTERDAVRGILWDTESGRQIQEFTDWDGNRAAIARFSPDGKKVAMSDVFDRTTMTSFSLVVDAVSGRELLRVDGDFNGFCPNGKKMITTVYRDNITRILDAESGRELQNVKGLNSFFFLDGKKVVTGGGNNDGNTTYRIWDIESGMKLQELESECGFHFSLDGKRFLTYVDVWDENNVHNSGRSMISRIDENKSITRYFTKSIVRIWDAQSVSELHKLELLPEEAPGFEWIAISHDGKKIISA